MLPISGHKECMYADLLQVLQGASACVCVHAFFQHIRKEKLCNAWQKASITQTRAIQVRSATGTSNTKAGYVFCWCPSSQLIVEVGGWIWNSGTGVVTSNEATKENFVVKSYYVFVKSFKPGFFNGGERRLRLWLGERHQATETARCQRPELLRHSLTSPCATQSWREFEAWPPSQRWSTGTTDVSSWFFCVHNRLCLF